MTSGPERARVVTGRRKGGGRSRVRVDCSEPALGQLEAGSPHMRAVLVGRKADATRVMLTTLLVYRRPRSARPRWAVVGPLHRKAAPYLLDRAAAGFAAEERT